MSKRFRFFIVNLFFMFTISHAQISNQAWPNSALPPNANASITRTPSANVAPTPTPSPSPTNAPITPKCYPETATVYFLPAPPTAPKITVLNPDKKDAVPNFNTKVREVASNVQEIPRSLSLPPSNQATSRAAFLPPPPCLTGLPDLIDEIPTIIHDRFSRLAKTDEKTTACECESCAKLIKNLQIFNFDQELLNGFLTGIGI